MRAVLLLAVVALVLLLAGWVVATYNRLVRQHNQVQAAGAQVDVQLKRRHDLILNLVRTVRGYAAHERTTLHAVVLAREDAVAAVGGPRLEQAAAERTLSRAVDRMLALAEAYPDLKASENFVELQAGLAGTEDKIAYARQFLNSAVQTMNTTVQSFPSNVVARLGGFGLAEYFRASPHERGAVAVRL
jgi:LemA protein